MKLDYETYIRKTVIENLLTAQETAARSGDPGGAIKLGRLILKLADKFNEKIVYSLPEDDQEGRG